MIYSDSLLKEIRSEYDNRRKNAEESVSYYEEILENDEEYLSALNEFNSARLKKSKANYSGDRKLLKEAEQELAESKKKMTARKKQLGITDDKLTPKYRCPYCNDSGYTADGKRCKCFNQVATQIILNELGIEEKPLPDFSETKYEDKNGLKKIYEKFSAYCDKFGRNSKNIVISGSVGTGKSFLSGCIANALKKKDFNVIFITASELDVIFLKYHVSPVYEKSFYLSILTGCDMLVIDDLGTEPLYKNVTEEYLLTLFSERNAKGMPYIVTTNLDQNQLLDRYGDRILSRLNDKKTGVRIEINGEDLRRLK